MAWSKSGAVAQPMVWCRLWLVLVFAVGGLAPGVRASADEFGRVKQVYDGDTVLLEDGRRVRYLGINAPEFREPFYLKAKRFNESLVQGREIRLEFDVERADAYDRLLASRMGIKAVEALVEGTHGVMTGLKGHGIEFIPFKDVISNKRQVNMEYYNMAKVLAR